ncbi:tRNA (adenosine(37)-N6)-threonylcarbamoyltransferase complex dimerization subunit type 1 TsaB [Actinoalloteichus caeruleus]|uniref:tRNA (adenosine(37)-N6)-threonylcarbamoyltransferase complex dimerization subunit type 1 TsaB n=1 Tax=Actinoalloteichus cyanogriseus TaxID=2893586 RepID=UPI0004AA4AEA|nr:tRNA (adenosine(37)-N6)-threonylcarbamoyltransferase complex dimerization subunit type 1 TsaB [Actinoalloteichus caeruleus]
MLLLAIDTATPAIVSGVVELEDAGPPRVLAGEPVFAARSHAELLTPRLRAAATAAGVEFGEVDALVCGVGPGPFTGLRVGMVTAAALGHALGRPVHPVGTLDGVAAAVVSPGPFLVVSDARRREVYWSAHTSDGARVEGPGVARPDELREQLAAMPSATRPTHLVGNLRPPGDARGEGMAELADQLGLPLLGTAFPTPDGLVAAASAELRAGRPPAPLVPRYLRQPDAAEPRSPKRVSTP